MLYLIYKIASDDEVPLTEPILYAVTNEKKLHKEFIKQRNMKIFSVSKKEFPQEEEDAFYRHHSSYYLKDYAYDDTNGSRVSIVSTLQEYSHVVHSELDTAYEISRSFKRSYHNLLSDEMKEAMKNTLYDEILMYVEFVDRYYMSSDMMMSENKPSFNISTLRIFLLIYGNTLSVNK